MASVEVIAVGDEDTLPAARNLGLERASGEWICFPEPGRAVEPAWLAAVEEVLRAHPGVALAVPGAEAGVIDLDADPQRVLADPGGAVYPAAALRASGARWDSELPAGFAAVHLGASYLMANQISRVAVLPARPATEAGPAPSELLDPRRYTVTPRRGYLDLLRRAAAASGVAPRWVQTWVLHDLAPLFAVHDRSAEAQTAAHGAVAEQFLATLAEIAALLDPQVVADFQAAPLRPEWRDLLLHGFDPRPWHSDYVVAGRKDRRQRLTRLTYRYTGPCPGESFTCNGIPAPPVHDKLRALPYFERTTLWERIVWLPSGDLSCTLDGLPIEVRTSERRTPARTPAAPTDVPAEAPVLSRSDRLAARLATSRFVRRYLGKAWVLIDRVNNADDSAEHLFSYLRRHQPAVNAWFVVERGTVDYRRLRAGVGRRVVPYGSFAWKLLMLNCEHLVSSHADAVILRPPALAGLVRKRPWRATFLNHGVIKDDLSLWLNRADLDLFVTSTPGECASVCGDGTTYRYTTKETLLSGMPRFDRVREAGERVPPEQRRLILIAPTWRRWLVDSAPTGTQRFGAADGLLGSEFVREWTALLTAPVLQELAEKHALTVATLFHPNLQPFVHRLGLPEHVETFAFEGGDVREVFARARVLVTDYSSMAFNAAYIDRPVVYFQFDRERMMQGGHFGRQGYFDYERDGFGPVSVDLAAALDAVVETVAQGPEPAAEYRRRIAETFPERDGRCCERVYEAIRCSTRPVSPKPVT